MLNIGVVGYSTGATLFLVLALVLLTGKQQRPHKRLLFLAAACSALWMGFAAFHSAGQEVFLSTQLLELLRDFGWMVFLSGVLAAVYPEQQRQRRFRALLLFSAAFVLLQASLTAYRYFSPAPVVLTQGIDWLLAGYLAIAVYGLVLVEHLFRNTRSDARRAIKYLCVGVGSIFIYDFYLYSDALLFQRIDPALWEARGFINALAVPLIGLTIARDPRWSLDIFVSRRIVFHTAALLGAGLYLLAMGVGGYYVKVYGGEWGTVAQVIFLFGAILLLAVLFLSGQARASLRVFINKHFFHYKYDYRDEWLRFIGTLSGDPEVRFCERVVRAIAEIIDSPSGVLWWKLEKGWFEPVAGWNMQVPYQASLRDDDPLIRFLETQEWVINLDEFERRPELYGDLQLPPWLKDMPRAWLITPLILHDNLIGFVLLNRSPAPQHFNWEDCDLLKTVGREAASHLAQLEASRALAEARQFETYNRLSTYVIHDLKNLIGQLSLVVTNAAKHKHNPAFMEDAIRTVEHSVEKMNRLLAHLRSGEAADQKKEQVDLCELLHEVAETMSSGRPVPSVDCQARGISANANRERFAAVIGHLVRNAQDATADDGSIIVRLFRLEDEAVIEVQDTGCGMDETFIRERLFRPFETTKGKAGMGVGVHETREFVRALGGEVEVISRPGQGSTFRLRIPISDDKKNNVQLRVVAGDGQTNAGRIKEIAGR
ncbi:PEP-CTERM system histidine kinase PrsK [Thiohalobacter sp. IOR34]|uniref:XrtA/PEP-CTERM system histidine kinase PrsK n=1 Tax=Thiohalobacter sp. IOR34 TaxID=3057176 RepID=UPI0025B0B4B7|nr:XrtA/PEP-CTERM system histidine kinase PrsK [Thiohalobacter sp. IOR34]WJW75288.1 PEP-CTERM system histidine kinase PrsK [Thiohalobacter sp. IOR34]